MIKYRLEDDVNDYVKNILESLGLKKLQDYCVESQMSDYMKEALKGSAKTKNKTYFGKPDFTIEKYNVPVLIENKLGIKNLIFKSKEGIKNDEKSIREYAVNGALNYATSIISSGKYKKAVVIGIAADDKENVEIDIYFVYGASFKTIKNMKLYKTLNFLENENSFNKFLKDCLLTEEEKHKILIKNKEELNKYSKKLNKLMHNHNITAPQRVLYVSGMLLSMQDIQKSGGYRKTRINS